MEAFLDSRAMHYAGLIGVALYLGSYAALQIGVLRGSSYTYAALNGLAAGLVLFSLLQDFNLSSAIIQACWIIISIVGIARLYYVRNWMSFSGDNRALIARKFPGLSNDLARRFVNAGEWADLPAGTRLTEDGAPNAFLYYLATGNAEIRRDGDVVAMCEPGDFIGEITCFSGRPANGSAILRDAARIYRIEVAKLHQMAPPETAMRLAIDVAIADDLRVKLARGRPETFYGGHVAWPKGVPAPQNG